MGVTRMVTVGIRELKSQIAAFVERAEGGEPIVVSRHGKPVAVMLPLDMDVEEVLIANSSALAARRASALVELQRGEFVREADLDRAIAGARTRLATASDDVVVIDEAALADR